MSIISPHFPNTTITTSSFINGEEGLNEHGLAVAMTFVKTSLEKIKPGFNSCFIVRYLLEKADTTEQAISQLYNLPIASNCNILLADKCGRMVVVECTPTIRKICEATKQLLKGNYGFMCQYDNEPDFETLWSSIFDLESLSIYRAEGDPRKKKFVVDNRLQHLIYK